MTRDQVIFLADDLHDLSESLAKDGFLDQANIFATHEQRLRARLTREAAWSAWRTDQKTAIKAKNACMAVEHLFGHSVDLGEIGPDLVIASRQAWREAATCAARAWEAYQEAKAAEGLGRLIGSSSEAAT